LRGFDEALRGNGRGRLQLRVLVEEQTVAAEFTGTFVASFAPGTAPF
jgi:hypothetical protein